MTNELHQAEVLQDAFNAIVWAQASKDARAEVRAESRLFDLCLTAGMDFDEPNHIEWAAIRINDVMGSL